MTQSDPMFRARLATYHRVRQPGQPIAVVAAPAEDAGGRIERHPLTWQLDPRGGLVEVHRTSLRGEAQQVYISATAPGVVKGWHLHLVQTDRFFVVRGRILLATFDLTDPTADVVEQVLDAERRPVAVVVPPLVAHGWMALGSEESWVLNCVSHEYDGTDEYRRSANLGPADRVFYDWRRNRDG